MQIDSNVTWMLFTLWFVVYWILGGVFFAIVSATRFMNTRKALFSCLFTVGSVAAAYGASVVGLLLARPHGARCPESLITPGIGQLGKSAVFQDVLFCDFNTLLVSGGLFFVLLLTVGMVALLVSRVEKQKPKKD